jgi:hypothetical protein
VYRQKSPHFGNSVRAEFIGFSEAIRGGDFGGSVEHFDTADLKNAEAMRKEWERSYLGEKRGRAMHGPSRQSIVYGPVVRPEPSEQVLKFELL